MATERFAVDNVALRALETLPAADGVPAREHPAQPSPAPFVAAIVAGQLADVTRRLAEHSARIAELERLTQRLMTRYVVEPAPAHHEAQSSAPAPRRIVTRARVAILSIGEACYRGDPKHVYEHLKTGRAFQPVREIYAARGTPDLSRHDGLCEWLAARDDRYPNYPNRFAAMVNGRIPFATLLT